MTLYQPLFFSIGGQTKSAKPLLKLDGGLAKTGLASQVK